jgi:hypothetical protein
MGRIIYEPGTACQAPVNRKPRRLAPPRLGCQWIGAEVLGVRPLPLLVAGDPFRVAPAFLECLLLKALE